MMQKHVVGLLAAVLLSMPTGVISQVRQKPTNQTFAFRRGQPVYIAAFHYAGGRGRYVTAPQEMRDYLAAEQLVRKEFEKAATFKPVDKLSDAEYVFVVYIQGETIEALAVSPEKYVQSKPDLFKGDLDPIREAAYGRYLAGPFKAPFLSRMCAELVRKFNESAMVK